MKKAALIVATHNQPVFLTRCVNSLFEFTKYENYQVYLIDNSSTFEVKMAIGKLKEKFPQIEVIRSIDNRGFGGAMNLGMYRGMQDNCDYFVLISDDTVMEENWLNNMIAAAEQGYGIVGPLCNYVCEKEQQIQSYGNQKPGGIIQVNSKPDSFIVGLNPLITRETIKRIGVL